MTGTVSPPLTANRGAAGALDFEALYRASRDDVYAYAQMMLRDRAAAEDVTSLAFERAYRKQRTYKPERGSARGWLFGIARNAALDELRKRKRAAESELLDERTPADGPSPEDAADLALRRDTVRRALATLPARDREIVALKFHAGLDNNELARVLDVSESNAGTLLHRAMTKLRKACHDDA